MLTVEEAKKANEDAIVFLKAQNRKKDKSILEAKVICISECPDPLEIDYPDCNLTLTVALNDANNTNIVLIVPCIRKSKTVIPSGIKKDSLVAFRVLDDTKISEDEKSIQVSDDNPDYDLDYCYADKIEPISYFSKISIYKKKDANTILYDTNLALTSKDKETRKRYIEKELKRVNTIISNYSTEDATVFYNKYLEFTKDLGEENHPYAEIQYEDGSKKIFPIEVGLWSPQQLLDRSFSYNKERLAHNAQIIASVNEFFKERGIILIVVPVPQHFEAFAHIFNFSKDLSTYNINRVYYMKCLLELGVEVLDMEPLIESHLSEPFHFYDTIRKDLHLSHMGAFYLANLIHDHLSTYEFYDHLRKNDYFIETSKYFFKVQYYGEEFKSMESITITKDADPVNKDSPFLLVGDSFSIAGAIQHHLANAFHTKINVINATSSYLFTTRMLQQRSQEISQNTKVCILVNTSKDICNEFVPFLDSGTVLFPNDTFFQNQTFHLVGKDLQERLSVEFDLDLSNITVEGNNYQLVFYLSSTDKQIYELKINSSKTWKATSGHTGHGRIIFPLSDTKTPLHIEISTIPSDGFPICNNQKLTLNIDKILLIEK